jgi:hypothetical protein
MEDGTRDVLDGPLPRERPTLVELKVLAGPRATTVHLRFDLGDAVQRAVTEQLKVQSWGIYDRYSVHELVSDEGDTDLYVVYERLPSEEPVRHVRRYRPFVETPHLFLTFAHLVDEKITRDRWIDWISRYGVLGLQRHDPRLKHGRWKGDRRRPFPPSRQRPTRPTKR